MEYNDDNDDELIEVSDLIKELYPDINFYYIQDFDDAIVGVANNKLVYSKQVIINLLMENMSLEEALEYYDKNIESGYYGENTPIFLNDDIMGIIYGDDDLFCNPPSLN